MAWWGLPKKLNLRLRQRRLAQSFVRSVNKFHKNWFLIEWQYSNVLFWLSSHQIHLVLICFWGQLLVNACENWWIILKIKMGVDYVGNPSGHPAIIDKNCKLFPNILFTLGMFLRVSPASCRPSWSAQRLPSRKSTRTEWRKCAATYLLFSTHWLPA